MSEYPFEISPLAETFGCEVKGVSLKDGLTDEIVNGLVKAIAHHSLVLLRDQNLSNEDQTRVTDALGGLRDQKHHVWTLPPDPETAPGKPTILGRFPVLNRGDLLYFQNGPGLCEGDEDPTAVVDEEDRDHKTGTSCWHTGDTEKFDVEVVNCLYAVVAPRRLGQTLYLDTTTSFEELDPALQERLEKMRFVHIMAFPDPTDMVPYPPPTEPISQPAVKLHAVTGRKYMLLNYSCTERAEGLTREENYELQKLLFDHVTKKRYVYAHTWRDNDFILWNCNGTMHKRGPLASTEKRVLRRTQASIPVLHSVREWDKSRWVKDHDGELWHPYPFQANAPGALAGQGAEGKGDKDDALNNWVSQCLAVLRRSGLSVDERDKLLASGRTRLEELARSRGIPVASFYKYSSLLAQEGRKDEALASLETAFQHGKASTAVVRQDPDWTHWQDEPALNALLARWDVATGAAAQPAASAAVQPSAN